MVFLAQNEAGGTSDVPTPSDLQHETRQTGSNAKDRLGVATAIRLAYPERIPRSSRDKPKGGPLTSSWLV